MINVGDCYSGSPGGSGLRSLFFFADVAKRGKISSSVGVSLPSEILNWNIPGPHSVLADL